MKIVTLEKKSVKSYTYLVEDVEGRKGENGVHAVNDQLKGEQDAKSLVSVPEHRRVPAGRGGGVRSTIKREKKDIFSSLFAAYIHFLFV